MSTMWEMVRERRRVERCFPPVRRAPRLEPAPLSPTQQRLWRFDRAGTSSAYHVTIAGRLSGPLDAGVLRRAIEQAAARHEALRTVFPLRDGAPVQQVRPGCAPLWSQAELGADEAVDSWLDAQVGHELDVRDGPLLRASLLRLGRQEHVLFLAVHHLVADGWSLALLAAEISASYRCAVDGRVPDLPPPALHLRDFVLWQREYLRDSRVRRYVDRQRERLSALAAPPGAAILTPEQVRDAGGARALRGGRAHFALDDAAAAALRRLAGRCHTTLFVIMLAAYHVLLHLRTGLTDIVVGSPAANRGQREFSAVFGFLVNTLPLHARVDAGDRFPDLVTRVHAETAQAYAHQSVPLEVMVADAGHPTTLFALHRRHPGGGLDLPGVTARVEPIDRKDTFYPLAMAVLDDGERLTGRLSYHLHRYRHVAGDLVDDYVRILAAVGENPDQPVGALAPDRAGAALAGWA